MTDTLPPPPPSHHTPPAGRFWQFPWHFCLVFDLTFTFCGWSAWLGLAAWLPGGFSANYHHFWRAPKAILAQSVVATVCEEAARHYYVAINIICCCFLSLSLFLPSSLPLVLCFSSSRLVWFAMGSVQTFAVIFITKKQFEFNEWRQFRFYIFLLRFILCIYWKIKHFT